MIEASGLGIYVHWPFCVSKCPYCDFNSHVAESIDAERWQRAVLSDLGFQAERSADRTVTSVFFGGGTPSLMAPKTVAAVLETVHRHWPVSETCEATLEANPSSAEQDRFQAFREAGVNRLSIGVQSFNDRVLAFLGRTHDAAQARAALAIAHRLFDRFSFDLIYGVPGQTGADWRREMTESTARVGEHLSAYQLTIEPGTAFRREGVRAAGEDLAADLYELTQECLATAGLPAYEVSNHARPGAACRHNMAIWQGGEYLGVGPGAHGRLRIGGRVCATRQERTPDRWLSAVEARGHGEAECQPLSHEDRREELLLSGLRLAEGVERHRFFRLTNVDIPDAVDGGALRRLTAGGLLILDDDRLRTTQRGRLCLDSVLRCLLAA